MITLSEVRDKYPEYADLTDAQLVTGLHQKFYSDMPLQLFARKIGANQIADEAMYAQTAKAQEAAPGLQNFDAAVGGAFAGIPLGVREILGRTKPGEFEQWRAAMKGLWGTPGGKVGTIVGGAVPATGAMMLPGANTVVGAGLIGAGTGLLQPTGESGIGVRRGINTALGGTMSAGVQYGMNKLGQVLADRALKKAADQAVETANKWAQLPPQAEATIEANKLGLVFPPSQISPKDVPTSVAGGFAGKAREEQLAALRNVPQLAELGKKEFGIQGPLTEQSIKNSPVVNQAKQVYNRVRDVGTVDLGSDFGSDVGSSPSLTRYLMLKNDFPTRAENKPIEHLLEDITNKNSMQASSIITQAADMRDDAYRTLNNIARSHKDEQYAQFELDVADALEKAVKRQLVKAGKEELANAFDKARTVFAKSYDWSNAINPATGLVEAKEFGKQPLEKLTGVNRAIAMAQQNYPRSFQDVTKINANLYSVPDVWATIAAAGTGHLKTAAGLATRPLVQRALLSQPVQARAIAAMLPQIGPASGLGARLPAALQDEYARLLASAVAPALLRAPQ